MGCVCPKLVKTTYTKQLHQTHTQTTGLTTGSVPTNIRRRYSESGLFACASAQECIYCGSPSVTLKVFNCALLTVLA